jgi:gamma-glutamylputrescine oxidase
MLTAEPKAYGSNWHASTRVESPARPRLGAELDVDVCVIGGGLAGLTAAREVARLGWSVVVLEAQSLAWSASGRNTGVVLPGFGVSPDAVIERVGRDAARALWSRSEAGAEYVRQAARDMPGTELTENGWLHVSRTDDTSAFAHEAALMAGEFGMAVEPWPADRVRETLHSDRYFHGLHYPRGFSLHPLNYALGLAAAAEAAGARIFEDTPVLEIDPAGVRKRVITPHARVRAAHVVLAGNVHMAALVPQFASTLLPIYTTTIVTEPFGEELADTIRYPGAISDAVLGDLHYRVMSGGRLMWSGRDLVWLGKPQRQAGALLRHIRRTYPALAHVKAAFAWIGVAGHTVHDMPQIGEVTPGLWLMSGFGGHGLNTTAMAGEIVARAIVEGDRTWQMFSPFALVWAGGAFGRAMQQVSEWARQTGECVEGLLARRRKTTGLRAEAVRLAATVASSPPVVVQAPPPVRLPEPEPVPEPEPLLEPEPVAEIVPEPVVVVAEPAPVAAVEVPEGPSSGAAPPIPPEPEAPVVVKRPKRGPKKKARAPQTLKDLSQQIVQGENPPADPAEEPDNKT